MERANAVHQSGERHATLGVIAFIFALIGAVLITIGAVLLVVGLSTLAWGTAGTPPPGVHPLTSHPIHVSPLVPWLSGAFALFWSFGLLFSGLQLIAMGALCQLLIHLEQNTRASTQLLDKIRSRLDVLG